MAHANTCTRAQARIFVYVIYIKTLVTLGEERDWYFLPLFEEVIRKWLSGCYNGKRSETIAKTNNNHPPLKQLEKTKYFISSIK